ncbi:MAG TPA: hypothetical protein PKZ76_00970, partial [Xanthomonadaceae bacterium]|nr:hypothetical protein [Xanthomonadaceae bacterium]
MLAVLALGIGSASANQPLGGVSDFEGDFAIGNWDLVNDPAGVGGSFNTNAGPPVELFVEGGDDGIGGNTDFQITIPADGEISFDWGYQSTDTECWDSGGYAINGVYTELACNDAAVPYFDGSGTVPVSAGDVFAFRVFTVDGDFGPGILGVTNFAFQPTGDPPPSITSVTPDSGSESGGTP